MPLGPEDIARDQIDRRLEQAGRADTMTKELTLPGVKKEVVWPGTKKQLTLRLDPDVVDFFKKRGRGYQSMINAVLRKYVEAHGH